MVFRQLFINNLEYELLCCPSCGQGSEEVSEDHPFEFMPVSTGLLMPAI